MANPADFPFLVQLWYDVGNNVQLCGVSIITHHFIMTAAHCLDGKQCEKIQIFPSTWRPNDKSIIHAIDCLPNELFEHGAFDYDIALVQTQEDLLVGGKTSITLPDPDKVYPSGYPAVIIGWGMTEEVEYRNHLMRGNVQVYDWNDCNKEYQTADSCADAMNCPVRNIPSHAICTIGQAPKFSGSCWGDSGGPCITDGELAGVMVGSVIKLGKCETGTPTVLMDVAKFVIWLHSIPQLRRDMNYVPVDG